MRTSIQSMKFDENLRISKKKWRLKLNFRFTTEIISIFVSIWFKSLILFDLSIILYIILNLMIEVIVFLNLLILCWISVKNYESLYANIYPLCFLLNFLVILFYVHMCEQVLWLVWKNFKISEFQFLNRNFGFSNPDFRTEIMSFFRFCSIWDLLKNMH